LARLHIQQVRTYNEKRQKFGENLNGKRSNNRLLFAVDVRESATHHPEDLQIAVEAFEGLTEWNVENGGLGYDFLANADVSRIDELCESMQVW
jgi:hypothetical protein